MGRQHQTIPLLSDRKLDARAAMQSLIQSHTIPFPRDPAESEIWAAKIAIVAHQVAAAMDRQHKEAVKGG